MVKTQQLSEDRGLPGLTMAMGREALLDLLVNRLPECRDGMELLDARVSDVQYSPGKLAQVLWKLTVRDPQIGRTAQQLVCVRALHRDEAAPAGAVDLVERYTVLRSQGDMARQYPLRTPWVFESSAHVLVHAFPLDPMLPTLIDVVDPRTMQEALHRAWRAHRVGVRRVRAEILAYTPGARAALRFDVLAEERDTGLPQVRRLVGKLDTKRLPARLFAGHWALWRKTFGRVSVAPPTGYVAVAGLSLQEFLDGTRLSDLAGTGPFVGFIRQTARAIAGVHGLTLPLLSTRGVATEMRTVDRWTAVLARLRPSNTQRLERLGNRLRRELAARLRVEGTVHGDFHLANVMVGDQGVTLIDWDQIAHGDPMVDVGRILASLRVSSLRLHGRIDGFADIEETFLRTYLTMTGADERRARLFESVALLVSAAAPFRLQREGWEDGAERMIAEVERTLELSLAGPRVAVTPQREKREVPFEERRHWAADRPYLQSLLVPVVHRAYGQDIEVTECMPKVHTRRDQLYVSWELRGFRGNERWRGSLAGMGFPGDSGRGRLRRLEAARALLAHHPDALHLPRPVGHLAPLSMIVFAPELGSTLAAVLGTAAELATIKRVAAALAYFHSLTIELAKKHCAASTVDRLRRRVARLEAMGHAGATDARTLISRLERALMESGERLTPTVSGLHPNYLCVRGSRVAASLFTDIVLADSRITVGDLLADLACRALDRAELPSAATQFRRAYAESSGGSESELASFEALSLLSRACGRAIRRPADGRIAPVLAYAASLMPSNQTV